MWLEQSGQVSWRRGRGRCFSELINGEVDGSIHPSLLPFIPSTNIHYSFLCAPKSPWSHAQDSAQRDLG